MHYSVLEGGGGQQQRKQFVSTVPHACSPEDPTANVYHNLCVSSLYVSLIAAHFHVLASRVTGKYKIHSTEDRALHI